MVAFPKMEMLVSRTSQVGLEATCSHVKRVPTTTLETMRAASTFRSKSPRSLPRPLVSLVVGTRTARTFVNGTKFWRYLFNPNTEVHRV